MTTSRNTRCRWLLGVGVVPALLASFAFTPTANAGDYSVRYCEPGHPLQEWTKSDTSFSGSWRDDCQASGTLGVSQTNNTRAGFTYTAWSLNYGPAIDVVRVQAKASVQFSSDSKGIAEIGPAQCFGTTGDTGGIPTCGLGGAPTPFNVNQEREVKSDPTQHLSNLAVVCAAPGVPCDGLSSTLEVRDLVYTFRDTAPPGGTGKLDQLQPSPGGGPVQGVRVSSFSATDVGGSGVKRVELRAGNQLVARTPDQCAEPYRVSQPCSSGFVGELAVDTSLIPDGSHDLRLVAIDVAGNEDVLASGPTLIQNSSQVGPGSDPGLRGAVNGSYGADDARLSAWWPATARRPSKNKAVQKRCKASTAYRRRHKLACDGRPALTSLRVGFSARKKNLVRGQLIAPDGQPVANARIDIVSTPSSTGAASVAAGSATTDASGRFSASIPVMVGSAGYRVQWNARARDTQPAATAALKRAVRASSSLAVSPGRTVYRRQRLVFTGRLAGRTGTPKGTAVLLQVNAGNGWRALTTVRARASGRWTATYRVLPQLRGRYRFRAVIRPSAAYAYASGTTRAVTIRIR